MAKNADLSITPEAFSSGIVKWSGRFSLKIEGFRPLPPRPSARSTYPLNFRRAPLKIESFRPARPSARSLKLTAFMGNRPNYGSKVDDVMMCENSRGKAKSGEMAKVWKLEEEWKLK